MLALRPESPSWPGNDKSQIKGPPSPFTTLQAKRRAESERPLSFPGEG
jgi:hypothetical protein